MIFSSCCGPRLPSVPDHRLGVGADGTPIFSFRKASAEVDGDLSAERRRWPSWLFEVVTTIVRPPPPVSGSEVSLSPGGVVRQRFRDVVVDDRLVARGVDRPDGVHRRVVELRRPVRCVIARTQHDDLPSPALECDSSSRQVVEK